MRALISTLKQNKKQKKAQAGSELSNFLPKNPRKQGEGHYAVQDTLCDPTSYSFFSINFFSSIILEFMTHGGTVGSMSRHGVAHPCSAINL